MGSAPFWETGSTLTPCSESGAGSGIQSVGTALVTGLRGEGELRLTAALLGAEVRKAKGEGQIAAGASVTVSGFSQASYLPALNSLTHPAYLLTYSFLSASHTNMPKITKVKG